MSILNPLKDVLNQDPLKSSFWEKLGATFMVFYGTDLEGSKPEDGHLGIYDYLTLGIPYLLSNGLIAQKKALEGTPLEIFITGLNTIIDIPRYSFAGAMTIISLPFVAIAQAITSIAGWVTRRAEVSDSQPLVTEEIDSQSDASDSFKMMFNNGLNPVGDTLTKSDDDEASFSVKDKEGNKSPLYDDDPSLQDGNYEEETDSSPSSSI